MARKTVVFGDGRRVTFGSSRKKRRASSACNLPFKFAKGDRVSAPSGRRSGDEFSRGGRKYLVVSYTTKNGCRVRYGQPIKG